MQNILVEEYMPNAILRKANFFVCITVSLLLHACLTTTTTTITYIYYTGCREMIAYSRINTSRLARLISNTPSFREFISEFSDA